MSLPGSDKERYVTHAVSLYAADRGVHRSADNAAMASTLHRAKFTKVVPCLLPMEDVARKGNEARVPLATVRITTLSWKTTCS